MQGHGGEPVIQILTETPRAHIGFEIAVGRGDHAHIDTDRTIAAERPEFALLQHAQQLDLKGRAGLADFVQEERAAIRLLEEANAILDRAGEGATLVAEELRFEQGIGQRTAVFGDEGLGGAAAFVMDGARHHFLAGTGLAGDQHGQIVRRDAGDQIAHCIERTARCTHHAVQAKALARLVELGLDAALEDRLGGAQIEREALVFLLQAPDFGGALQGQQELFRLPGL